MTEQEWLRATEPRAMMEFLQGKVSDRKLRLFATSCCRKFWHMYPNEQCRNALEAAEKFADNPSAWKDLWEARESLRRTKREIDNAEFKRRGVRQLAIEVEGVATIPVVIPQLGGDRNNLRDIFGNPFLPVAFDSSWRTSTVMALATGIYDERAFDRLPILADALQDAECDSDDILNHLRQPGEHCRGCWALDLVLGRE